MHRNKGRWFIWKVLQMGLLALAASGCGSAGPKMEPVEGRVTYQGKPLHSAIVRFIPVETTTGVGGQGRTDSEGKYRIAYLQGGEGLPAGKYKVTVSQMLMPDGSPGPENVSPIESPAREMMPSQYSDEFASKIMKDVSMGGGPIDLALE